MPGFIIAGIISGFLFGIMDGLINANPFAQKLNEVFRPIAKTNVNIFSGIIIDLAYGFIMAGIFLMLYKSLPGETGLAKGISFSLMAWFFRVVMSVASQWMMYNVPVGTLIYTLGTGLIEMLLLGIVLGIIIKP